jgi:myb proto-oncogene protein
MMKASEMKESFHQAPKKDLTRKRFSEEEDQMIRELVEHYGTKNWDEIAKAMGGNRTRRQLRERWQAYLTPDIALLFTEAEDQQLEILFLEFGPQWARIASIIGGKSAISVRNRHRSLQSMKAKGQKSRSQKMESDEMNVIEPEQQSIFEFTSVEIDSWECDWDAFL